MTWSYIDVVTDENAFYMISAQGNASDLASLKLDLSEKTIASQAIADCGQ
jgi:hypothetical protein